jgi:hypothetical protein
VQSVPAHGTAMLEGAERGSYRRVRGITRENFLHLAYKILHSGTAVDINIDVTEHCRMH